MSSSDGAEESLGEMDLSELDRYLPDDTDDDNDDDVTKARENLRTHAHGQLPPESPDSAEWSQEKIEMIESTSQKLEKVAEFYWQCQGPKVARMREELAGEIPVCIIPDLAAGRGYRCFL